MKVNYPQPGRKYNHYKGGLYQVLFLSKQTETGEVLVNYQSLLFGSYFSRPLDSWNELTPDGEVRFILKEDEKV